MALPKRLLAFYGDDFTGSTDVLDVAARAGLDSVLFLDPPDEAALARFPDARVIGLAGISRSQNPAWMAANLPAIFESLRRTGCRFVQYKVCSTFDSAPDVGSIGCAASIGLETFSKRPAPLVVGAPALRRYVAFGNLFAGMGEERYRIDRHPVMSRHPVTPMREADLRRHIAAQTDLSVGLVDLPLLATLDPSGSWLERVGQSDLLLFDTVDEASLLRVGALLASLASSDPVFSVASSGLLYALVAAWRDGCGLAPAPVLPPPSPVERLLVVSGSCSPVTAGQIGSALRGGFVGLAVDPVRLVTDPSVLDDAVCRSLDLLAEGRDVLVHTATGPADEAPLPSGLDRMRFNDSLGVALGNLLRELLARSGLRRAVVAGGDTSSHAVQQLGIRALTVAAPLAPGCPLCRAHADDLTLDGVELALKGGQMGQDDFFLRAKSGAGTAR